MQLLFAFAKSKTFRITVLLQVAGPLLFSFGNWTNIIQYVSGFGMAYAAWHYFKHHKPKQDALADVLHRLHIHVLDQQKRPENGRREG